MCSCSLFFRCHSVSPWWPLAFLIFLTAAIKFQRNWSPLFFISRSSSFFVIHVNVDIKSKSKERIVFTVVVVVVFFLSLKVRVAMRFTAETHGYLNSKIFTPPYITGWTYGTILSEPKFLGCIDNQIFLPMVLSCARELRYKFWREEK